MQKPEKQKNAQMKIPEEGVSRNTRGRLSMKELSLVFEDKLIESLVEMACLQLTMNKEKLIGEGKL